MLRWRLSGIPRSANFKRLKELEAQRISIQTGSLIDFLEKSTEKFSRFALLDHMDSLSREHTELLRREWQAIIGHVQLRTRVVWRSGGLNVDFVDPLVAEHRGEQKPVGTLLRCNHEKARMLHAQDRVHTYGSLYIADLIAA